MKQNPSMGRVALLAALAVLGMVTTLTLATPVAEAGPEVGGNVGGRCENGACEITAYLCVATKSCP